MVTICTEHTSSRNMEVTFKENHVIQVTKVVIVTIPADHTTPKMEATN